uniref:hypothetical protein n=1 Tax=Marinobacterium profundum TaxID=1714300 RepID=UPI0008344D45|nr:hypothetical protein [Marinobacterium profundum]
MSILRLPNQYAIFGQSILIVVTVTLLKRNEQREIVGTWNIWDDALYPPDTSTNTKLRSRREYLTDLLPVIPPVEPQPLGQPGPNYFCFYFKPKPLQDLKAW